MSVTVTPGMPGSPASCTPSPSTSAQTRSPIDRAPTQTVKTLIRTAWLFDTPTLVSVIGAAQLAFGHVPPTAVKLAWSPTTSSGPFEYAKLSEVTGAFVSR